jgi:hypothetical protein
MTLLLVRCIVAFVVELNRIVAHVCDDHRILIVRKAHVVRRFHSVAAKMNDLLQITVHHPQDFRGVTIGQDQLIRTIADDP